MVTSNLKVEYGKKMVDMYPSEWDDYSLIFDVYDTCYPTDVELDAFYRYMVGKIYAPLIEGMDYDSSGSVTPELDYECSAVDGTPL